MRIAQVSPLFESVPPKYYGGTERVVSYLTEELVRQGHEVTLFASADSVTRAHLVPICPSALRLDPSSVDSLPHYILMLERVLEAVKRFDIVHFHIDYLHYGVTRRSAFTHVTTLHGRLDIPDLVPLYREFDDTPVVAISDAQRVPLRWLNWQGTVHHGLPADLFRLQPEPGKYVAFLGRISREKRVDRAIEIARRLGMPIRIAAKIDKADRDYFATEIEPLFDDPLVEYVGEIGESEKQRFLGGAYALLFPIDWPEPFGMVMIEAMACGTPVVAFRGGSVPEIIDDGVTGFSVRSLGEAVRATERVATLSRRRCRQVFEERFTAARMATDYLQVYRRVTEESEPAAVVRTRPRLRA